MKRKKKSVTKNIITKQTDGKNFFTYSNPGYRQLWSPFLEYRPPSDQ